MQTLKASRRLWGSLWWMSWAIFIGVALVQAQPSPARIAVLTPGLAFEPVLKGLREGLHHAGYAEGERLTLVIEDTQGAVTDLASRATRLIEAKPHVLVTVATPHTTAAKQVTSTVPIVFTWVGDPVQAGFTPNPGSSQHNLTGVAVHGRLLAGKRLELLREIAPRIARVLALVAAGDVNAENAFQSLSETAKKLSLEVVRRDVTSREQIAQVLRDTPARTVDAIISVPAVLIATHIDLLIRKAQEDRIPLMAYEESMVERGALISYAADFKQVGMQTAKLVITILQGKKPAELPIQGPEEIWLAINLATAKAIGLTIPHQVLQRADRLIDTKQ